MNRKQIPSPFYWIIGRCGKCREFNLYEEKIKGGAMRYQSFLPEEFLSQEEYTLEQAQSRLEQLKYFRK